MRTDELDYELPADRIAAAPLAQRDQAKLMVIDRAADALSHRRACDLPDLLRPGDLLVVNDSRVLPAYLEGVRAGTGGRVTGLYLHTDEVGRWTVLLESRGSLTPGERITLDDTASLDLLERREGGAWLARLDADADTPTVLNRVGRPPLPPYIRKARRALDLPELTGDDVARYNTVYARAGGSVAAPTAGLHFTPELLARLEEAGIERTAVTLHVGLGTFAPIRADRVEDHAIHREWMSVPAATIERLGDARRRGGRIVAVGTTTVRALESLPPVLPDPVRPVTIETGLFIAPGTNGRPNFAFRYTDALLTNFHLPRSSLLALVAALPGIGIDRLKRYYATAVAEQYRFYSYGDAMLIV